MLMVSKPILHRGWKCPLPVWKINCWLVFVLQTNTVRLNGKHSILPIKKGQKHFIRKAQPKSLHIHNIP
jgi:hypothetical protein